MSSWELVQDWTKKARLRDYVTTPADPMKDNTQQGIPLQDQKLSVLGARYSGMGHRMVWKMCTDITE